MMENIINTILSRIDDQSLQSMSQKANTSPGQAKSALSSAIPLLMNALAKKNSNPESAASLQQAIQKDHDGSILDNLGGFFNNPEAAKGPGILNHVLGNKQHTAAQFISKDAGVDESSASKILEFAAPLVMGFLGKNSGGGGMGIGSLLNSFTNTQNQENPQSQSFINNLLDRDNDGEVMDDIKEMGKSFFGKMMK